MVVFITGPVRSGKSRLAQQLAETSTFPVTYVATSRVDMADPEWTRRLARHRLERPRSWLLVETATEPAVDLALLLSSAEPERTILVDSVGTWLGDQILRLLPAAGEDAAALEHALFERVRPVLDAAAACRAQLIVVGEETGWGVVPMHASARVFCDVAGRFQQRLAALAESAFLVVAGCPIDLRVAAAAAGTLAPVGWR